MLSSFQDGKLLLTFLSMTNWNRSARTKQPRGKKFSVWQEEKTVEWEAKQTILPVLLPNLDLA